MSLVIDSSITVAWYFPDESNEATDGVMSTVANSGAVVPAHWRAEIANAFLMAVRRKRIDAAYRSQCLVELTQFKIAPDLDSGAQMWSATVQLAELYNLTAYDAAYLELAQRRRLPLATLDAALARAAKAAGVETLG